MAQYDVFSGENGALWLDVQSNLISDLNTCIIVPLNQLGTPIHNLSSASEGIAAALDMGFHGF